MWTTIFREFLFKVPSLIVLGGCAVYFVRTRSAEGLIALVGQLVAVCLSVVSACLVFGLAGQSITADTYKVYAPWVRIGGFTGAILFGLAFLRIVLNLSSGGKKD